MKRWKSISPQLGRPRIYRQVTFDRLTFDRFQGSKRHLSAAERLNLTNSEVLRVLLLSHPLCYLNDQEVVRGRFWQTH